MHCCQHLITGRKLQLATMVVETATSAVNVYKTYNTHFQLHRKGSVLVIPLHSNLACLYEL